MIEIIEKKSKFLTYAYKLNSIEEVDEILESLNKEHKKATHICYAYTFFGYSKCSDNGEPSGTAGLPILNVITKNKLDNCLIVVVRYFGGIKLGAGGLVRAYSNCATSVIKQENITSAIACKKFCFDVEFNEQKLIDTLFHYDYIKQVDYKYDSKVIVSVVVNNEYVENLQQNIKNILNKDIYFYNQTDVYY